ncbi:MAG: type II secretion system F family protein [Arthrobacter sp.]|uniref:type II secretion system F family protein n=1 Tax=unclassified Arthrobacter TaxID=235627 RepID=UPI002655012C|nr:hypothetical protein [Micrococcaceae bacterium]MDN5812060.1 hypothetical protein [Micrococcaceae bacterium]MDN5825211.1 hypothetical protein [Micrococcaceae bacterium]MDN5880613.1 hypothetical protein [Micrococcaceae bacterium]MDN5885410.1 hypothetical protein [Micrococcaceae bacterium]
MSLVILAGSVLAGLACWFLPTSRSLPSVPAAAAGRPAAARRTQEPGAGGDPGRKRRWFHRPGPASGAGLDDHVEMMRQLAALLRSGRHPGEAWLLLESSWDLRIPHAGEAGRPAGGSAVGGRGPRAGGAAGARDIVSGCRAARICQETGSGSSAGIERHLRDRPEFRHAWQRLLWCISLSESTGAALGDLLHRLADQLEAEQDRRRALEAALAGPRMTQKLLAWLPALGLGLAQLMGADPLGTLTGTDLGRMCLVAGGGLWWANALWSRHLLGPPRPHRRRGRTRGAGRSR